MSRVAVVGAGYVGLTTAACLARLGHEVVCADVDAGRVAGLSRGEVPILEAGLGELVAEGLASGRLRFVVGAAAGAERAEFVFVCVATPQGDGGEADLGAVEAVIREIAPRLGPSAVVVSKSTIPVGSSRLVAQHLAEAGAPPGVGVAANPEFLREGTAVEDTLAPSRVVVGADDPEVARRVADLYRALDAPVVLTDPTSAELIKYASNAFLATRISFVNAIADLCEAVDADVQEVTRGMGYDPRIGRQFLEPGPGWGGSCFPKDTAALLFTADRAGYDFDLLRGVVALNRRHQERVVAKVRDAYGADLRTARVGVWGLTFKANTDDLRDSPAMAITGWLLDAGAEVVAYDPAAGAAAAEQLPGLRVVGDPYAVCAGADVLVLLTEWDEFRSVDLERAGAAMARRVLVDARNLLDPTTVRSHGFAYRGLGR